MRKLCPSTISLLLQYFFIPLVYGSCISERDLDFETCNLVDLKDEALREICHRIGLDMEGHVLPVLREELDEDEEAGVGDRVIRVYSHADFVAGAEECLQIEHEINRLASEDPSYLEELEREALAEEPKIFADIIHDALSQDDILLKDMVTKLINYKPDVINESKVLLKDNESLEDRPDILGYLLAKLMSDDPSLLDKFDELFLDDSKEIMDFYHNATANGTDKSTTIQTEIKENEEEL